MDLEKLFNDLEKVQDALYAGNFSGAKTILYAVMVDVKTAQQSMHQTGLTPRRRMVACPNCKTMFGVELSPAANGLVYKVEWVDADTIRLTPAANPPERIYVSIL